MAVSQEVLVVVIHSDNLLLQSLPTVVYSIQATKGIFDNTVVQVVKEIRKKENNILSGDMDVNEHAINSSRTDQVFILVWD